MFTEGEFVKAGLTGVEAKEVLESVEDGSLRSSKSFVILMNSSHCTFDSNFAFSFSL